MPKSDMGMDELREHIRRVGSQKQLAIAIGVSQPTISYWLRAKGRIRAGNAKAIRGAPDLFGNSRFCNTYMGSSCAVNQGRLNQRTAGCTTMQRENCPSSTSSEVSVCAASAKPLNARIVKGKGGRPKGIASMAPEVFRSAVANVGGVKAMGRLLGTTTKSVRRYRDGSTPVPARVAQVLAEHVDVNTVPG
jgi:DNA-binding transcriptional regulator YdaS (Cro superfamily)